MCIPFLQSGFPKFIVVFKIFQLIISCHTCSFNGDFSRWTRVSHFALLIFHLFLLWASSWYQPKLFVSLTAASSISLIPSTFIVIQHLQPYEFVQSTFGGIVIILFWPADVEYTAYHCPSSCVFVMLSTTMPFEHARLRYKYSDKTSMISCVCYTFLSPR